MRDVVPREQCTHATDGNRLQRAVLSIGFLNVRHDVVVGNGYEGNLLLCEITFGVIGDGVGDCEYGSLPMNEIMLFCLCLLSKGSCECQ